MRATIKLFVLSFLAGCGGSSSGPMVTPVPPLQTETLSSSGGTGGGTLPTGGTSTPMAPAVGDVSFGALLNTVRRENGVPSLGYDSRLDTAAQSYAEIMLRENFFSHTGRDGSNPGDRISAAGYDWRAYGENIASGFRTEESVLKGWTDSPGHHANNINPAFEEFGLGYAVSAGGTRWVLLLATER